MQIGQQYTKVILVQRFRPLKTEIAPLPIKFRVKSLPQQLKETLSSNEIFTKMQLKS